MPQHSIGDVGDLDVQSNSRLVAERKGLVWLRITQQADLGVAVRLELAKGELFTCRTMQETPNQWYQVTMTMSQKASHCC